MLKEVMFRDIDGIRNEMTAMADDIFDHPEIGLEEFHAQKVLTDWLEKEGFAVERGVVGVETAFKAVYRHGEGGPNIGLLCEYDALPGIGHACGHHMQGPSILAAAKALKDAEAGVVTEELEDCILNVAISPGIVSVSVHPYYNGGIAHALFYGLTCRKHIEKHHLHGEVVSYGILVMLTADKQYAERDRLLAFNRSIGLPTHLADIHARPEDLPAVTEKALAGIDVRVWPYPVAQQMLIDAVMELEQVG